MAGLDFYQGLSSLADSSIGGLRHTGWIARSASRALESKLKGYGENTA